ncbi:MAG: hypothetical protein WBP03_01480 [Candidatus Saccharimonadales bacterium]|jgi:hypothetical protein
MNMNLDTQSAKHALRGLFRSLNASRSLVFFVLLTTLYSIIVWRINVLSSATPTQAEVASAEQKVSRPKISNKTIEKLHSLEDNSVRVQALFNDARNNPFQ